VNKLALRDITENKPPKERQGGWFGSLPAFWSKGSVVQLQAPGKIAVSIFELSSW
jgi:hypothetical protein